MGGMKRLAAPSPSPRPHGHGIKPGASFHIRRFVSDFPPGDLGRTGIDSEKSPSAPNPRDLTFLNSMAMHPGPLPKERENRHPRSGESKRPDRSEDGNHDFLPMNRSAGLSPAWLAHTPQAGWKPTLHLGLERKSRALASLHERAASLELAGRDQPDRLTTSNPLSRIPPPLPVSNRQHLEFFTPPGGCGRSAGGRWWWCWCNSGSGPRRRWFVAAATAPR